MDLIPMSITPRPNFVGHQIGIVAKTRKEITAVAARYLFADGQQSRLIKELLESSRGQIMRYRSQLLLSNGEVIEGPTLDRFQRFGDNVQLTFETWVLLGAIHVTGVQVANASHEVASRQRVDFPVLMGQQRQFTAQVLLGIGPKVSNDQTEQTRTIVPNESPVGLV